MPDDTSRDEAALTTSVVDQYNATARDLGRAHGAAAGAYYSQLVAAGMYADHAAQITSVYATIMASDWINSKNTPSA